jgi:aspartate aminotransferase-like enzyme
MAHKQLFIPGPVDVHPDVLAAMATPMIGHRSKDASALQRGISEKLQRVFQTKEQILLSTSSGSGLMEAAVRSFTSKGVAVFSVGAFGKRWYEMAVSNGRKADLFEVPQGQPTLPEAVEAALATGKYDTFTVTHNETSSGVMNPVAAIAEVRRRYLDVLWLVDAVSSMGGAPIPVDELGIDCCITSTQKALALPPGMAICSVTQRAIDRARGIPGRGFYFDMVQLYDFIFKKDHQYPSTPSLSHMYALEVQLAKMLEVGLEAYWERHRENMDLVRAWGRRHFELLVEDAYASRTVTVIRNTPGFSIADLNKELGTRGFQIANGYGDLKDKTFRIAHMGWRTRPELEALFGHMEEILNLK